jgi:sec-independent protein translocase protein TatA
MFTGLESPTHLLLLLIIILLLFGAKRLPEMGRSIGQGIREFKEGMNAKETPQEEQPSKAVEGEEKQKERHHKAVEKEREEKEQAKTQGSP